MMEEVIPIFMEKIFAIILAMENMSFFMMKRKGISPIRPMPSVMDGIILTHNDPSPIFLHIG